MKHLTKRLDWLTTLVPFLCILFLCILFIAFPEDSSSVLGSIRFFLGDQFGSFYLLMGLGALFCSLYAAFSRFGSIRLGGKSPRYSNLQWGSMMFTAGLAADILFYSLCEWMLYAGEPHISDMGSVQDWASVYPLFHWGPIPWSFYIILAVAFGFMLHVRKRNRQKYSEACRPVLGKRVDGALGRIIDLTAVFALLAGTATTFSLATPLLSMALSRVTGIPETPAFTIAILIAICIVYTMAVYFGMKGVARLASSCVGLFFVLLAYFFFGGGEMRYIVETGLTSLGNLSQNFIPLATWTDAPAHLLLSTELDYFLLGLLDGVVRGDSVFYRQHQPGTYHTADRFGWIFLRTVRHLYFFYHSWKLRAVPSDAWKAGSDGNLCSIPEPL